MHGHSGWNRVDLSLQDNARILYAWVNKMIMLVGRSPVLPLRKRPYSLEGKWKAGRPTIFFLTAVDPREDPPKEQAPPHDVTQP